MQVTIRKSDTRGQVQVPSSKSLTIRGLMCAALSKGESEIVNPLVSEDSEAAAAVLGQMGIKIRREDESWYVTGGTFRASADDLYCGESATTLRFMTAICSLIPGEHRLVGGPSLTRRPVKSLITALKMIGGKGSMEGKTTPPVTITGGPLKGGETELPGNISSQFISALLLVAPFAEEEVSIRLTTPMTSKPYVLMTLRCLRQFGINVRTSWDKFVVPRKRYRPTRFEVEGDWSSASYFLALGALSEGIQVDNIRTGSLQGDRVILDFLRSMGAKVMVSGSSVTVSRNALRAINADLSDCIDLLPTMAVLAALADGTSVFTGIERARIKESNRVAAVREGLQQLNIPVTEDKDRLTITGLLTEDKEKKEDEDGYEEVAAEEFAGQVTPVQENIVIDSHEDHRIAMAFGVFGAANGGVMIDGAECVAKTFPGFWEMLRSVGAEVEMNE